MSFDRQSHDELHRLQQQLRQADAMTPALAGEVIDKGCSRIKLPSSAEALNHVASLIAAEAWTEMALALVATELPLWAPRRLLYDDDEWWCSLSKQRALPDWLDESVDGHHERLPLAILLALVEVRLAASTTSEHSASPVPRCTPAAVPTLSPRSSARNRRWRRSPYRRQASPAQPA